MLKGSCQELAPHKCSQNPICKVEAVVDGNRIFPKCSIKGCSDLDVGNCRENQGCLIYGGSCINNAVLESVSELSCEQSARQAECTRCQEAGCAWELSSATSILRESCSCEDQNSCELAGCFWSGSCVCDKFGGGGDGASGGIS